MIAAAARHLEAAAQEFLVIKRGKVWVLACQSPVPHLSV